MILIIFEQKKFKQFLYGLEIYNKYNLETYIHERWLKMMPNGKFGQSGRRHLFPILLLDFLCVKVFFSFHPDPVHFFLLSGLDLSDTCFLCSVSYAWQSYFWFPILNIWRFFVAFWFVDWKDYYLVESCCLPTQGWWLMISDGWWFLMAGIPFSKIFNLGQL